MAVLCTLRTEGAAVRALLLAERPKGDHFEWALRLGVYGLDTASTGEVSSRKDC